MFAGRCWAIPPTELFPMPEPGDALPAVPGAEGPDTELPVVVLFGLLFLAPVISAPGARFFTMFELTSQHWVGLVVVPLMPGPVF
ncbi:hypothetical protein X566_17880 [Afipia sp. P52-10]|nr:hypothetical protein X566_17880 [Afipia sp. P52-10]